MEYNKIFNVDCMDYMKTLPNKSINLTLTDIPYDCVNRASNGLRNLDKGKADILLFDLDDFLKEINRITKGTVIIFCGPNQVSTIYDYFKEEQNKNRGTVRQLIWRKTNPSPLNGKYIYLSGIENAIWFKKRGNTFNARYKNTVFDYPGGRAKLHPTEKNHKLLKELIEDNSNENDIVFDPCAGSGSTLLVAKELNRRFLGCEIESEWYNVALERL